MKTSENQMFSDIFRESKEDIGKKRIKTNGPKDQDQLWRRGVVVITTAQLHSTKPELRFCTGSNPARWVSEIRDGEDL